MRKSVVNFLLYVLFIFSIISCNVDTEKQIEYRNQNFIWFVPHGESEGRWVKIDFSGKARKLTSGHCTEFYFNGEERIKYNLDRRGEIDTTFYFDLNNNMTHYSTGDEYNMENYYYQNGEFESFLWNGSLAISGIVEDNNLIEFSWENEMAEFYKLTSNQTYVWRSFESFNEKLTKAVLLIDKRGAKSLSESQFEELDSLRLSLIDSTQATIELLSNFNVSSSSMNIKKSTIQFLGETKSMLEGDMGDFLLGMRQELNPEKKQALAKKIKKIYDSSRSADRRDKKAYTEWLKEFRPGDFLIKYLDHLDKK